MNKNRQIISELKDFFRHNDSSKAVNAVNKEMGKLVIALRARSRHEKIISLHVVFESRHT